MADLTKSLLDAMSIIATKSVDRVSSDRTIKAIVKKNINISEGKYLVNYNNGDFYAYTQSDSNDLYQVDEQVYVLIPEGDMGQKKFIIGRVEKDKEWESFNILSDSSLSDYTIIGNNAIVENTYKNSGIHVKRMQPLLLNSHKINDFYYCYLHDPDLINSLSEGSYDNYNYPVISIDEEVFSNSIKRAKALLIRAKFKAAIDTDSIGNYGIIVNIAFSDGTNNDETTDYSPKIISYILDTTKMTGNPMKFYDYTSQYIISNFDSEKYLYIDSIIAFSEGFVSEDTRKHNEDDDINIYIDNLEIMALDEVSAINGDYKLKLSAPQGNTIKIGQRNNIKIKAEMSYLNQNITNDTIFYWGIKDPSVTSASDDYNAKLGSGYKFISTKNNSNELFLSIEDLLGAENIFVCTAVYKSDIILKTSISIYNNNNKLDITIESDQGTDFQFDEGSPTLTCLINGKTSNYQAGYSDEAFSFIWSREDEELGTVVLNKTKAQLIAEREQEIHECNDNDGISNAGRSIIQVLSYYSTQIAQIKEVSFPEGIYGSKITCQLKDTNMYATYLCSVYRGDIYVGYGSITLKNSKTMVDDSYYITITNDTQVFQYDESGIAPNSQKHNDPIEVLDLTATFYNPQGIEITPKEVRWIIPKGKSLINIPRIGLETNTETNEKYFIGNIYPLSIKEVYDNTCDDNQLTVVITHSDGKEYRKSTNLLFTKIGEIGTNGTDIVVKINELIEIPKDECLTIIKPFEDRAFYNGYQINSKQKFIDNTPALRANLYTNNTQVIGNSTKWTIAGSSNIQAHNYKVETNENSLCTIKYDGINNRLDTRIIRAETTLGGKYFYSFYGMPAIEYIYSSDYNYNNYKIKIMKDKTLKTVLYDSNGMNPTYNQNQGVHVEFSDWPETGYIEWEVESGIETNEGLYENPNFLLSRKSKAKTGSRKLEIGNNSENLQTIVLATQDTGKICADEAPLDIKQYINEFLTDVEKIGMDNILVIQNKIDALWNRLAAFKDNVLDITNIYIKTIYREYSSLFSKINNEYDLCKEINQKYTEVYNKVQAVWRSEWPSVITNSRLCTVRGMGVDNIQQLIWKYQQAYDDRSNEEEDSIQLPVREEFFRNIDDGIQFLDILDNMDQYYLDYINSPDVQVSSLHPILVEYAKILVAYLSILIDETQKCFDGEYSYLDAKGRTIDLYEDIAKKYDFAYNDWALENNSVDDEQEDSADKHIIGMNIYNAVFSAQENIAGVFDNIRGLYQYYQDLYLGVKKYQIAEDSEILNIWESILNGQEPNLLNQIYVIPNETFNGLYMNNNVVGTVSVKKQENGNIINKEIAKIYIPIIMTLNTYELAALNGWDGTSVEVNDDYIMTPQIGAGIKDSATNSFTGMVMGVVGNGVPANPSKVNKVGLIGYYNGRQSVFIDSKTGKATFGLPEDDINTLSGEENDSNATIGTNEGRIELIPGGVSKIGNWKIGSRFLYNIVEGNYERRSDDDSRDSTNKKKMMIPHDKYGIILSSDQPYIHTKGKIYKDLRGINYKDEYNDINPGDSLELRIDPGNKSLFSIIQHTTGFGDDAVNEKLFYGYKASSSEENVKIIRNYVSNENTGADVEYGNGAEYYVYGLVTDENGKYVSYYEQQDLQNSLSNIDQNIWKINETGKIELNDSLSSIYWARSIDKDTGVITYDPNQLRWKKNNNETITGISNGAGWSSITERTSSDTDVLNIDFQYQTEVQITSSNIVSIGTITNNSVYDLDRIALNYSLNYGLNNIDWINSENIYYCIFCTDSLDDGGLEKALLRSDPIPINNCNNMSIELKSYNNSKLNIGKIYNLKLILIDNNYNSEFSCSINGNCNISIVRVTTEKERFPLEYGYTKITNYLNAVNYYKNFDSTTTDLKGKYVFTEYSNGSWKFEIKSNGLEDYDEEYDFVIIQENADGSNQQIGGRFSQIKNKKANFIFNGGMKEVLNSSDINNNIWSKPSSQKPWYIYFYHRGFCTSDVIVSGNSSSISNTSLTQYSFTPITKETYYEYSINNSINYNDANIDIDITLTDCNFESVKYFRPRDINYFCVENNTEYSQKLQGFLYAKTFWENNVKKVTFYKNYYKLINIASNNITQYGYINIISDNNNPPTYYKYIKTLKQNIVNDWFDKNEISAGDVVGNPLVLGDNEAIRDSVTANEDSESFKNAISWKEFLRVGLDENGRLFSNGLYDKKTYSRTGRMNAFGKVPNLYGQEIRIQQGQNLVPIIKIFSKDTNLSDIKTTYITQGRNDTGNISIRTAENRNYVELAASLYAENDSNTIPDKMSYVRVGADIGIQLQSGDNNQITLFDTKGLSGKITAMSISSGEEIKDEISYPLINYQIVDNYSLIKTPYYVVSSFKGWSPKSTYSQRLDDNNYRIKAFGGDNNKNGEIHLEVGEEASLNISPGLVSSEIDNGTGTVQLKNRDAYIKITNDTDSSSSYFNNQYIELSAPRGGKLKVNDNVLIKCKNGLTVSEGSALFEEDSYSEKSHYTRGNIFVGNDIHIGYNREREKQKKAVYFYNNSYQHVKLDYTGISQMVHWYNWLRWVLEVDGNTAYLETMAYRRNKTPNTDTEIHFFDGWSNNDSYYFY